MHKYACSGKFILNPLHKFAYWSNFKRKEILHDLLVSLYKFTSRKILKPKTTKKPKQTRSIELYCHVFDTFQGH